MDFRDNGALDQPSDFSGRILLKNGTMYIRADHAFSNCTAWVASSWLWPAEAGDKIGDDAPVTLYGGGLAREGVVENLGTLALASGICSLRPRGGATIQPDSIARGSVTPGTRALCRIQDMDSVTTFIKPDSTTGLGLIGGDGSRGTNKKIVPYMHDYVNVADSFRTLISHDAVTGLVALADSDYVHFSATTFPAVNADGNDNVILKKTEAVGGSTYTLTGNTTVNALVYHHDTDGNAILDLQGYTLTLKSGVLIANDDLSGNNDNFTIQNGTIDVGNAEMIIYSSMGGNYPTFMIKSDVTVTGTGGLTLHQTRSKFTYFQGDSTTLDTLTLVDCDDGTRIAPGSLATNAVVIGARSSFSTGNSVLRPDAAGQSLVLGEVHGTLYIRPGHTTEGAEEGLIIGGSSADHVGNHVRLLGNGVLPPHSTTISDLDQTQLDGGVIGMSAEDNNAVNPGEEFTVDLHGGQVIIDIFADDNYDQLRVITSDAGTAVLSLDAGGGTGSELVVRLHTLPAATDSFMIVQVDGASAITGKFSNGNTVTADYNGVTYAIDIDYAGDTGNDVVLSNARILPKGTVVTVR